MTALEYSVARLSGWRRSVRLVPLLLTLLALPLVAAGRTAYAAVFAYHWTLAAVRLGYTEARDRAG